jgi:hypothetical protein
MSFTLSGSVSRNSPKSLITGESWGGFHLESLLPLKEIFRETTEFGFLLRHYWIPATILTFRQSSQSTLPDGRVERCELEIERKMARCRSNECLWRETIRPVAGANGDRPILSEMLCSYDCYEQTYASDKPILFKPPGPDQKTEARQQALYRLPMLCPPGPVPIGFSWYAKVGDDYMNYRLDAEDRVGDTSVLIIRREGRFTLMQSDESTTDKNRKTVPVVIERKGVSVFALNRCVVLEDRFLDRVVEVGDGMTSESKTTLKVVLQTYHVGATNQVVTRLIRSTPMEKKN